MAQFIGFISSSKVDRVIQYGPYLKSKGQFHVRDLFLGKLNSDDDFAERLLNPRFNSISSA